MARSCKLSDLLAAARLGRDPAGERIEARVQAAETLGALLPRFLARQRAELKSRTYQEVERHLLVQAEPLHARALKSIDRAPRSSLAVTELGPNRGFTPVRNRFVTCGLSPNLTSRMHKRLEAAQYELHSHGRHNEPHESCDQGQRALAKT